MADDDKNTMQFTIETGEPFQSGMQARQTTIRLDGVEVFSELVYDTEPDGSRSARQARLNGTRVFASKLSRLLEDDRG